MKKRQEQPNEYWVTVQRERVVVERRTVRVIAYTADAAKMLAKQKRPREGWELSSAHSSHNSGSTTTFGPSEVALIGPAQVPADAQERHQLLNNSTFVVRVKGEY